MSKFFATALSLRWLWISLMGTVVAFATFVFIYLAVYIYVVSYPVFGQSEVSSEELDRVVPLVGVWGARFFFLVATVLAASRAARKAGELLALHGMLVGILAALLSQTIIYFLYPPVELVELSTYLALGVFGGWLGSVEGRKVLAGQEALYSASRQIATARHPYSIAAAIGENLGGPDGSGVLLWRVATQTETGKPVEELTGEFVLLTSWTPFREQAWPAGSHLSSTHIPRLDQLTNGEALVWKIKELPHSERRAWKRRNIRTVFMTFLVTPDENRIGLLMVTFSKRRRLSRGALREYLTISTQAALALENLQLVDEAKRAGRETGALLERQRISHDIHDTLAQGFASIVMSLTAAELTRSAATDDRSPVWQYFEEARQVARRNLAEARRVVWALRPEPLDRDSLPEAIRRLSEEWSETTRINVRVFVTGTLVPLSSDVEIALLRITQESLANVQKHAFASRVVITLTYTESSVSLKITDDGVGFDVNQLENATKSHDCGFGLTGMRERTRTFGGVFTVESDYGKGTKLTVELPNSVQERTPLSRSIQR
jgi:signal transduction histidine kinase